MRPGLYAQQDHVYATWLDDADPAQALAVAQGWAEEAAERHVPYSGLMTEADDVVQPYAERVAPWRSVRVIRVVAVGRARICRCPVCQAIGIPSSCGSAEWRWREART